MPKMILTFALSLASSPLLPAQESGTTGMDGSLALLGKGQVDYWGSRKPLVRTERMPAASHPSVWIEPVRLSDGRYTAHVPAPQVLEFLENPSTESARGYLRWQRERVAKLRRAMELLETVASEDDKAKRPDSTAPPKQSVREDSSAVPTPQSSKELLYFKQADCVYCGLEDQVLAELRTKRADFVVREIPRGQSPELWKKYGVTVTPTIVIAPGSGPVTALRGLASLDQILAALNGMKSDEK